MRTETTDCIWTEHDTSICDRAEASGLAINANTGKPLTFNELKSIASQYNNVRSSITVDEFLKGKVNSKPFEF